MHRVLLLALLAFGLPALAQYDAGGQNTQGANIDASKLDPATKARIRTEGTISGIPAAPQSGPQPQSEPQKQAEPQKEGDAAAGASSKDPGKEKAAPPKAR